MFTSPSWLRNVNPHAVPHRVSRASFSVWHLDKNNISWHYIQCAFFLAVILGFIYLKMNLFLLLENWRGTYCSQKDFSRTRDLLWGRKVFAYRAHKSWTEQAFCWIKPRQQSCSQNITVFIHKCHIHVCACRRLWQSKLWRCWQGGSVLSIQT